MLVPLDFSQASCGYELRSTILVELYKRTDQISDLANARISIWTLLKSVTHTPQ